MEISDLKRFVAGADVFSRQSDGTTIAAQYAKHGISLRCANTDRVNGWAEILTRFGEPNVGLAEGGVKPTLFIHKNCGRLIETLPTLQHDPNRPEDVLKVDADEDGIGGDDAADALRYLVATKSRAVYCVDTKTGKRTSLQTANESEARQLVETRNNADRQPAMNFQIAQVYLQHGDPALTARTWQDVMETLSRQKSGNTLLRWQTAMRDRAFDSLRHRKLIETTAEHFLAVLKAGTISSNMFLRRLHNYAVNMRWVPLPVLPKPNWPVVRHGERRAITLEEHQKIIARELNPATRAYYQLLWHLGGAQTDIANLTAEDINWEDRTIAYRRHKTGVTSLLSFGDEVTAILKLLPASGLLFPALARIHESHRAKMFVKRLATVGVSGVSLHSYRYAWAERAKEAGYPERFAMQALGHSSKAVHRAYARKAQVVIPPLEEYEKKKAKRQTKPIILEALALN